MSEVALSTHPAARQERALRPFELVRRGGTIVFAVQVAGAGVAYAQQVVLARVLGAGDYGTYTYLYLYAGFAALLAGLGLPAASIRFLPAYRAAAEHGRVSAFVRRATRVTYATALTGAACAVLAGVLLHRAGALAAPAALLLAALLLPALAGSILNTELARARGRMTLAYLLPLLVRPALVTVAVVLLASARPISAAAALGLTAAVAYATLAVQQALTRRLFSNGAAGAQVSLEEARAWRGVGLSLLAVSAFVIVLLQLDILIVGAIRGAREAGIYAAASKTAALVSFVILAVNAAAAPQFAALWEQQRHQELRALVARLAGVIFWPSLAIALALAVLSGPLLELFGAGFGAAQRALVILLAAQLINASAGSVGYLLTLTGHHREAVRALAASTVVFACLTALGTALDGLDGAAIGSLLGFLVWNLALGRLVVNRLGIWPAFIPAPSALRARIGR